MATKNMKKVSFYLDREAQAIVKGIPSFYRSLLIRNMIKKAASEGRLDAPFHNTLSVTTATPVLDPKPDAQHLVPRSIIRPYKRLKRTLAISRG